MFRVGDCVAPRLLAESIFDGHRLAREIDGPDPEVALPFLRERPMSDAPSARRAATADRAQRTAPARRAASVELLEGSPDEVARRIGLAIAGREVVVAAGRGAGSDLTPFRDLAERLGARFAVSRPQVEAGAATRKELVGASSSTVAPDVYLAFGVSGGAAASGRDVRERTVIAVNNDPVARIFDHADLGVVADAASVAISIFVTAPFWVRQ